MEQHLSLQSGSFSVGCNYWASHAGTRMWSDWHAEIVDLDFEQLSQAGLRVLRVFPLWPDFQPLKLLRGGAGEPVEFRLGEEPLTPDEYGRAGVDPVMVDRFRIFSDLAEKHGLKLIVGLVTGWMSGRLFVPPAFDGMNVLTDPVVLQWQVRMVRLLVRRFKSHPAILAWDLGNECNCMSGVSGQQAAWAWTHAITSAIRLEDPSRQVVSGMHSLAPGRSAHWTIQDQAELTDVLTTHPYPYFTPHCDQDPVNTIRTILHSTAESRFYADIGGKPCLVEEIGTLGPILAAENVAAEFIRTCLFSLWAHDCLGLLWWCAYDQLHLEQAPYDWAACERELGLFRIDRSSKPVLHELSRFCSWLEKYHAATLEPRVIDAVCILTEGQDQWGAAYSSFILAKQAGFDLEFQFADQPLKPAKIYLVPSVKGMNSMSRRFWLELLNVVKEGAILYLSHDDCLLSPFNDVFGIDIQTRQRRSGKAQFSITGNHEQFSVTSDICLNINPKEAVVLAQEIDDNPVFTRNSYGSGEVFFLSLPIESALANMPGCFHQPQMPPFWQIYHLVADRSLLERVVIKNHPMLGVTEHKKNESERTVVLINYSPERIKSTIHLISGWHLSETRYGNTEEGSDGLEVDLPGNEAVVMVISKKSD